LDCELYAEHAAGDHLIVIGKVTAMNDSPTGSKCPLLYYRGQYRTMSGK
ncbi:MAG: flavin reductase, partial [Pseudomonas sp.]|nr:flavin reductase [Pseudomonas sp.]